MSGNTALYAAGAFLGSEVVGVTNFTGIGESGTGDDSTPPIGGGIPPGLSGRLGELSGRVSALQQQAENAKQGATVIREVGGATNAVRETVTKIQQVPVEVPTIPDGWTPGGDGPTETTDPTPTGRRPANTPTWEQRDKGQEGYDIQDDYDGPGAEIIRGGAESLHQGGQVVKAGEDSVTGFIDFTETTANTVSAATGLVTTGQAPTKNTHVKSEGKVQFDFSGDGNAGGKLSQRFNDVVPGTPYAARNKQSDASSGDTSDSNAGDRGDKPDSSSVPTKKQKANRLGGSFGGDWW